MKKVLIIMESLAGGGAEKVLINLLNQFDYSAYQVTLCLVFNRGLYLDKVPHQVTIRYLYKLENKFFKKGYKFYRQQKSTLLQSLLIRFKTKRKYDCIISFMEGLPLFFHRYITNRSENNISWIHCDLEDYHWTLPFFNEGDEEKAYSKMQQLVFVSDNAQDGFCQIFNKNHTFKRCIHNLIDKQALVSYPTLDVRDNDRFTVCCVSSLIEIKALDRVMRVAKMFKEKGYSMTFWIIGEGHEAAYLKELRKQYALEDSVHLLGGVFPPYSYFKATDIYLNTSISEGFSLTICEAFCFGTAVVATKTAGATELLDNGSYGILTDHDDHSIYEGIKQLVDNRVLLETYKEKALKRSAIFDASRTIQEVYAVINNNSQEPS